jgi:hypothetical protein
MQLQPLLYPLQLRPQLCSRAQPLLDQQQLLLSEHPLLLWHLLLVVLQLLDLNNLVNQVDKPRRHHKLSLQHLLVALEVAWKEEQAQSIKQFVR